MDLLKNDHVYVSCASIFFMKKYFVCIILWGLFFTTKAQSINELKELIEKEHYTTAKEMCIKMQKKDAEAAYWHTQILLMQGEQQEADIQIDELLKKYPDNKLLKISKAQGMLNTGKTKEAKVLFQEILASAGAQKADLCMAVGRAYALASMKNCDPDFAMATLQEVIALQSNNAIVHILKGDVYRKKLDGGNAVLSYTEAMQKDSKLEALANYKIGKVYASMANCEALTKYYTASLKANAKFTPAARELFISAMNLESPCVNIEMAKNYFVSFISIAELGLETELLRVDYHNLIGESEKALMKAKEILSKWPKEAPNELNALIGMIYSRTNDHTNTILWIEKFLNTKKNTDALPVAYLNKLGAAYSAIGDFEKSKITYLRGVDGATEAVQKIEYLNKAADEAIKAKAYASAASIYEDVNAVKKAPTAADYYRLGSAYYNAGNCNRSNEVFLIYAQKFPADWRPPLFLANCEAKADSNMSGGNAIANYQKFIELAKNDVSAKKSMMSTYMYLFAYEYQIKKNTAAAIAHLDKVLALDPAHEDALKYKKLLVK